LGKSELRLEATGRQVALVVKLSRIRHPLIDQDQAWPVFVEERPQHVTRARGFLVIGEGASEKVFSTRRAIVGKKRRAISANL
jgi:hypothetical protein